MGISEADRNLTAPLRLSAVCNILGMALDTIDDPSGRTKRNYGVFYPIFHIYEISQNLTTPLGLSTVCNFLGITSA